MNIRSVNVRQLVLAVALVVTTAAVTVAVQDGGQISEEEMMKRWMEYATPGDHHKILTERAGKWDMVVKHWMTPGEPATESTATCEIQSILGGRYVTDLTKGDFNGMPFEGHGTYAYDNMEKKFLSTWYDNMGTGIMMSKGTLSEDKMSITFVTEQMDPISQQMLKVRAVDKKVSGDERLHTMYHTFGEGPERKVMEITYKRAKPKKPSNAPGK